MLTAEQIRDKIYALADLFDRYYAEKNWAQARYAYESASMMAVFMELPQEDMYELFMNHATDDDDPPEWGRFDRDKAHECFERLMWGEPVKALQKRYHDPQAPDPYEDLKVFETKK